MELFKKVWTGLVRLLSPSKPVGGLEISDTALRFLEFRGDNPIYAALRLPPGIVESGKVKDRTNFVEALRALHQQITPEPRRLVNAVLTIPANDVYVQAFGISRVADVDLAEAANLNLRMISPVDINTAYYGWQRIGVGNNNSNQIELLGAFVARGIVDEFVGAVREAGYGIAAVEFSTLSLSRSLFASDLLKAPAPYLTIQVQPAGLYFMILRNRNLAFNYFAPWSAAQGGERVITMDSVKSLVELETQRILNFYSSHWGGQIRNAALITSTLSEELSAVMRERFPALTVETVSAEAATCVQGAAIRGLVPRIRDLDISLTDVGVQEAFRSEQTLRFVSLWRSIIVTVFATLLLLFVVSDIYLRRIASGVVESSSANLEQPETVELLALKKEAAEFNELVVLAGKAKAGEHKVAWLLDKLDELAVSSGATLKRIYIQSSDQPVLVVAAANKEQAAVDFKNKLVAVQQLSQVDLPLSSITLQQNGEINFTITFKVTSWKP